MHWCCFNFSPITEEGMPSCSSFLISSDEEMVMGCEGKGAGEAPSEREPSPVSNDIKQSREKAFPYLLCCVSLPSSTIVHPKVKTSQLLIKLSLDIRRWRNSRFGFRGVCLGYCLACYTCLGSIGSTKTKLKFITFSRICGSGLNTSLRCP